MVVTLRWRFSTLLAAILICAANPAFGQTCADWRDRPPTEEELREPAALLRQTLLRQTLGDASEFTLIAASCEPVPVSGRRLYLDYVRAVIQYSQDAQVRETMRCWKLESFPEQGWRCSDRPFNVMRFGAYGVRHHVDLPRDVEPEAMLKLARYMSSECFRSQLDQLDNDRNRARIKSNESSRVRIRTVHRRQPGWVIRTLFADYHFTEASDESTECPYTLVATTRGRLH